MGAKFISFQRQNETIMSHREVYSIVKADAGKIRAERREETLHHNATH